MITIAFSRGRLLEEATAIFKKAGYNISDILKNTRKLVFEYPEIGMKAMVVRPTDVPAYVEYGAADCGIVGKDTLMEENYNLYEPLDLKIGKCKLIVAAPDSYERDKSKSLRVATKYPAIASDYFSQQGINVEIVKLYGSVELAPIVGLSDVIVDLTATGETLKKNKLQSIDLISDITARLIVNRVSMKVKSNEIKGFITKLQNVRTD
ncbi:MAG: ATP phosphoribosyltransferase [Candidatus Dadabacteria bacterium]|nr:ATP phosphoribosyltransferase [Candidatus Dadabacteria bacterium]NIS10031.1 ATP phosphoribosyltransferase [Candidatus Dadabacteria bacterium]NIY21244.1 ATP phosphoribosyltransferase [Candidatus Dadabacteria bacterium]